MTHRLSVLTVLGTLSVQIFILMFKLLPWNLIAIYVYLQTKIS